MVKPEWGTKRTCPKCSTRFYDLGKDDPVHCIECGTDWVPEPVLKSKQPLPFEAAPASPRNRRRTHDLEAEDLAIDEDEEPSADEEVDLATGDDDLGVETARRGRRKLDKSGAGRKFPVFRRENSPKARRNGAVAQLGERRNGIAKVRGSIPLGSTIRLI